MERQQQGGLRWSA